MVRASPDPESAQKLLERILKDADPDNCAVASRLLREFGSLGAVLAGSKARQRRIAGNEAAVERLGTVHGAMMHVLRTELYRRPILTNAQQLQDYLRADMAFAHIEHVRVLFLDTKNGLIVNEIISSGTVDGAPLRAREVLARALEIGAVSIIIVHNHPSGDPTPSRSDIDVTRAMIEAGRFLDICVHDHIIVGRNGYASLRARGLV